MPYPKIKPLLLETSCSGALRLQTVSPLISLGNLKTNSKQVNSKQANRKHNQANSKRGSVTAIRTVLIKIIRIGLVVRDNPDHIASKGERKETKTSLLVA